MGCLLIANPAWLRIYMIFFVCQCFIILTGFLLIVLLSLIIVCRRAVSFAFFTLQA